MTKVRVSMEVNQQMRDAQIEPRMLLVSFLREELGLTGTHVGCETTNCGACTVLLDGRGVKSCTVLALQAEGKKVTTIEGIGTAENLNPIQLAFWEKHGLQCGFCTPGMILASYELLEVEPDPDEKVIREALSGNLCRCTGYVNIIKSVKYAAKLRKKGMRGLRKGAA
ncbi:MAG: (2Fe-2S)-binding protein [Thaumarchaeota archaeon]|nr:MAG: (2Fe-2S)-binding protein [Nitrososphaerota archaeon]